MRIKAKFTLFPRQSLIKIIKNVLSVDLRQRMKSLSYFQSVTIISEVVLYITEQVMHAYSSPVICSLWDAKHNNSKKTLGILKRIEQYMCPFYK